jgi:hypothetical protein
MKKQAISVTLGSDNLTWLSARVGAAGARSVSELLDRLITDARTRGSLGPVRSVIGTIDLDSADPMLDDADAVIAEMFDTALRRPVRVRELPSKSTGSRKRSVRSRG